MRRIPVLEGIFEASSSSSSAGRYAIGWFPPSLLQAAAGGGARNLARHRPPRRGGGGLFPPPVPCRPHLPPTSSFSCVPRHENDERKAWRREGSSCALDLRSNKQGAQKRHWFGRH